MERPVWDALSLATPLDRVIGALNTRLRRWSTLIARPVPLGTRTVSSGATLTSGDDVIFVNTTGGAVTLSVIVPASELVGKAFYVRRIAGANNVTFDPLENIDGAGSAVINSGIVISDGNNWFSWQ